MAKKDELIARRNELKLQADTIAAELQAIERAEFDEQRDKVIKAKEAILPLIEHGRTSCSDDCVCNGFSESIQNARCAKCALIDLDDCSEYSVIIRLEVIPRP